MYATHRNVVHQMHPHICQMTNAAISVAAAMYHISGFDHVERPFGSWCRLFFSKIFGKESRTRVIDDEFSYAMYVCLAAMKEAQAVQGKSSLAVIQHPPK